MSIHFNCECVDFVVFGVRTDELDVDGLEAECDGNDESELVALEVEHYAIAADEACAAVSVPDVLGCFPGRLFCFLQPGLQRGSRCRMALAKLAQILYKETVF
jgi:hypothetical protein